MIPWGKIFFSVVGVLVGVWFIKGIIEFTQAELWFRIFSFVVVGLFVVGLLMNIIEMLKGRQRSADDMSPGCALMMLAGLLVLGLIFVTVIGEFFQGNVHGPGHRRLPSKP